jgi:hypothetical protein
MPQAEGIVFLSSLGYFEPLTPSFLFIVAVYWTLLSALITP